MGHSDSRRGACIRIERTHRIVASYYPQSDQWQASFELDDGLPGADGKTEEEAITALLEALKEHDRA